MLSQNVGHAEKNEISYWESGDFNEHRAARWT